MTAYYNENEPYAAQWLRNLIDAGEIAPGHVDERDIRDVTPNDLKGFTQCHFFAGIGVWSLALKNAGWPDNRPVWTGSCPCQPFSSAGKGAGFDDDRLIPVRRIYLAVVNQLVAFRLDVYLLRGDMAEDAGAYDLPAPIKDLMSLTSKVMKVVAYRI